MKRNATKTWWIAGVLVLIGIGTIGFCSYKALRPFTPFGFLAEVTPVPEQGIPRLQPPAVIEHKGIAYIEFQASYSLPGDFAEVRTRVEQELFAKGYKRWSVEPYSRGPDVTISYIRDDIVFQQGPLPVGLVTLFKDRRHRINRPGKPYTSLEEKPGWTFVIVDDWVPQSPLEFFIVRCGQWISEHKGSFGSGHIER